MVLLFIFYYLQAKQTLTLANWSWKLETSSYIRFLGGGLRLLFSINRQKVDRGLLCHIHGYCWKLIGGLDVQKC
uniref:Uncharacterized protein n=1 Tax=Aegilops tauschii subsp. strangulata TaxID=200361 RepID=A0A453LEU9_AEGTS